MAGLIVTAGTFFDDSSRTRSSRWRHVTDFPAIYFDREFVAAGGLISYGT